MKKNIYIGLFFIVLSLPLKGQYKFQYAQYQQAATVYNPAFTGIEDFVDIKLGYRNRWAGLDESPTSILLAANIAIKIHENNKYRRRAVRLVEPEAFQRLETSSEFQYRKSRRQGFGAWIVQNDNARISEIGGFLSYSYHLPISDYIIWSMGASMGAINGKVDLKDLTVTDPLNDPTYNNYIASGDFSSTRFAINMGTVLYAKNWHIGYAVNNLVNTNFSAVRTIDQFTEEYKMQHNVILGFADKRKYGVVFIPGLLLEYAPNVPINYTISLRARYEDAIWGGLAYRGGDAANISLGLYLTQNIALNYAFEYSLSEISGLNKASTHEVILCIKLNNKNFSRAYIF